MILSAEPHNMYLRAAHAELDIPSLRRFVQDNPLGILITAFQSANFPTIQCTHVPWVLDVPPSSNDGQENHLGTLRGHIARANPHAKAVTAAVQEHSSTNGFLQQEVSVLFNGPAHSYVTPQFYVKTKPETGKVVPTWDYSAVQATGMARIFWDTQNEETRSFLQKQITNLTDKMEASISHAAAKPSRVPWKVTDAPAAYVDILRKNIVGIEISITRLEGKYKMSQEMGDEDREGVVEGFNSLETDLGREMARTVEERGFRKTQDAA